MADILQTTFLNAFSQSKFSIWIQILFNFVPKVPIGKSTLVACSLLCRKLDFALMHIFFSLRRKLHKDVPEIEMIRWSRRFCVKMLSDCAPHLGSISTQQMIRSRSGYYKSPVVPLILNNSKPRTFLNRPYGFGRVQTLLMVQAYGGNTTITRSARAYYIGKGYGEMY